MGLTQKILLFTSLLVVALVVTTLAFTTFQADRLAHKTIDQGLAETRGVWETFQADRYNKLKLGVRVLGNDPAFKAAVADRPGAPSSTCSRSAARTWAPTSSSPPTPRAS